MPEIDILKNWDVRKHGITGLVVAVLFGIVELVVPVFKTADPSCQNQVKYLQQQNTALVNDLLNEKSKSRKKDTTIHIMDSAYHQVIKPYKSIIINHHQP